MNNIQTSKISSVFAAFPDAARARLQGVRLQIFEIAGELPAIKSVEESLKWGQPSYVPNPKTGTPIRLGLHGEDQPVLFVHCQTTLVADHSGLAPPSVRFVDNRAVHLEHEDEATNAFLRAFITAALTYHLEKVS